MLASCPRILEDTMQAEISLRLTYAVRRKTCVDRELLEMVTFDDCNSNKDQSLDCTQDFWA